MEGEREKLKKKPLEEMKKFNDSALEREGKAPLVLQKETRVQLIREVNFFEKKV